MDVKFATYTYLGVLLFTDRFLISDPHERRQKIYDELVSPHLMLPNKWTCKLCQQTFSGKMTVIDHLESVHLQLPNYQCPYCPKTSTSSSAHRMHIHRNHREEHSRFKYQF